MVAPGPRGHHPKIVNPPSASDPTYLERDHVRTQLGGEYNPPANAVTYDRRSLARASSSLGAAKTSPFLRALLVSWPRCSC
jgi:hypothetical protein